MRWRAQEATGGDRLCVCVGVYPTAAGKAFPAQNAQEIIIKKVFTAGFRCSYRLSLMRIVARFHTLLLLHECDFQFFLCVFCFRSPSFAYSLPCPSRIPADEVNCTKTMRSRLFLIPFELKINSRIGCWQKFSISVDKQWCN